MKVALTTWAITIWLAVGALAYINNASGLFDIDQYEFDGTMAYNQTPQQTMLLYHLQPTVPDTYLQYGEIHD